MKTIAVIEDDVLLNEALSRMLADPAGTHSQRGT